MPQISEPLVTSDAELLANSERDDALDSHTFTSNRRNERVRIQKRLGFREPEARGTGRRGAGREVFDETIAPMTT
jgi:hypothetical protein